MSSPHKSLSLAEASHFLEKTGFEKLVVDLASHYVSKTACILMRRLRQQGLNYGVDLTEHAPVINPRRHPCRQANAKP